MALHSPRLTQKEKEKILKLRSEGLNFEVISQRIGRPPRTCARVVKAAEAKQAKQTV
jgi:IS30 family transposase